MLHLAHRPDVTSAEVPLAVRLPQVSLLAPDDHPLFALVPRLPVCKHNRG